MDSGGQGYLHLVYLVLTGEQDIALKTPATPATMSEMITRSTTSLLSRPYRTEDIVWLCTEIMVALKAIIYKDFDYDEFRNYLNELWGFLLVANDDEIVKSMSIQKIQAPVMQEGT